MDMLGPLWYPAGSSPGKVDTDGCVPHQAAVDVDPRRPRVAGPAAALADGPLRQVERAEILIRYADGQSTWLEFDMNVPKMAP